MFDSPASKSIYASIYDHSPFSTQHTVRMSLGAGGVAMAYQAAFSDASRQVFSAAGTPAGSNGPPRREVLVLSDGNPQYCLIHKDDSGVFATAPTLDETIIGSIGAYKGAAYECGPDGWELTEYSNPTIDARQYQFMVMEGAMVTFTGLPNIGTPDSWCCRTGQFALGHGSCVEAAALPSSIELTIGGFTSSGVWPWAHFNGVYTLNETLDYSDVNANRKGYASSNIVVGGCTFRFASNLHGPRPGGITTSQCGANIDCSVVSGGLGCTGSGNPFFQTGGAFSWQWCQLGCQWGWTGGSWGSSTPANPPFPLGKPTSLTW